MQTITHISPSMLEAYEQCPRRFTKRYLKKETPPPVPQDNLVFGSFVHKVLEIMGRTGAELDEALYRANKDIPITTEQFIEAKCQLADYLAKHPIPTDAEQVLTEVRTPPGYRFADFPAIAIIDRIDFYPDRVVLTDYKTGNMDYTFVSNTKAQMLFYACVVEDLYSPDVPIQIKYDMVTKNKQTPLYTPSHEELETFRNHVKATIPNLVPDDTPKPSWLCPYCEYHHTCPAYTDWQTWMGIEIPDDTADLDVLLRTYSQIQAIRNIVDTHRQNLQNAILTVLDKANQTQAETQSYVVQIVERKTTKIPARSVLRHLEHIPEVFWERVFSVNAKNLLKVSSIPEEIRARLEQSMTTATSRYIRLKEINNKGGDE